MRLFWPCRAISIHGIHTAVNSLPTIVQNSVPFLLIHVGGLATVTISIYLSLLKTEDPESADFYFFRLSDTLMQACDEWTSATLLVLFLGGILITYFDQQCSKKTTSTHTLTIILYSTGWFLLALYHFSAARHALHSGVYFLVVAIGSTAQSAPLTMHAILHHHQLNSLWSIFLLLTYVLGSKLGWTIFRSGFPYSTALQGEDSMNVVYVDNPCPFWIRSAFFGIALCLIAVITTFHNPTMSSSCPYSCDNHAIQTSTLHNTQSRRSKVSRHFVFMLMLVLSGCLYVPQCAESLFYEFCGVHSAALTNYLVVVCFLLIAVTMKASHNHVTMLLRFFRITGSFIIFAANLIFYFYYHSSMHQLHFTILPLCLLCVHTSGSCMMIYHVAPVCHIMELPSPAHNAFYWCVWLCLTTVMCYLGYIAIVVGMKCENMFLLFWICSLGILYLSFSNSSGKF